MVFSPPAWVPKLPFGKPALRPRKRRAVVDFPPDPPDSITLAEFWGNEKYGRQPVARSRNPFTCGVTGKTFAVGEMRERYELLARALAKRMGWRANAEMPWDKVVCVYSFNSVRAFPPRSLAARRRHGRAATEENRRAGRSTTSWRPTRSTA